MRQGTVLGGFMGSYKWGSGVPLRVPFKGFYRVFRV